MGYHGSRTSSRRALLDAVGASVFVVSSGQEDGSVVLPDADIVAELEARGQLFRTDVDDAACAANRQDRPGRRRAARRLRQHSSAPWGYAACAGVGVSG